ncbi:hypothetical protein LTR84_000168 [Exophiala bonariae]|uniref:BRCT domain-containing protein n=1 Tax=Exophiala bonariae TaxID=1690606 RepID=A0AAV9NTT9_9EURO|nr:hypothetical protein LTR84_000168 [Exophiala bonariae]
MAPRKVASPARPRRVTRARAAGDNTTTITEEPPKRKATAKAAVPTTTATKASEAKSRVTKKTATTAAPKAGTRTARSTKAAPPADTPESDHEEEDVITVNVSKPQPRAVRPSVRSTATKATTIESSLAAAPRRRVKVTPLDPIVNEPEPELEAKPEKKTSSRAKKEKPAATASTATSRSKRTREAVTRDEPKEETSDTEMTEPLPKKRGRTRTNVEEVQEEAPAPVASKTRGRPKKEKVVVSQPVEEPSTTVRQTRTRTGSNASVPTIQPTIAVIIPRKKVTFQDLPDEEEEKENVRPAARTGKKAASTSTKKTEPVSRGIRAKPIRKGASATTAKATRGRAAAKNAKETDIETSEKIQQRALTPKKITQVAKASVPDSDESEDELAGAKTPVRDLSMSPKRGIISSSQRLSPAKKLDFTTVLTAQPKSPKKIDGLETSGIASPPRRNPASPAKEQFDQSPRRAPEGVTIFRAHLPDSSLGGSLALSASNLNTQLSQSPKRGLLDSSIFPASAAKLSKSPFKASLLSSPARRLFSPLKQKTPARTSPSPTKKASLTPLSEVGSVKSPGNVDLAMTSHFRSSVSPQRQARVYRMSDDELAQETGANLDFDQSVLTVRSPLKVDQTKPFFGDVYENMEVDAPSVQDEEEHEATADEDNDEVAESIAPISTSTAADHLPEAEPNGDETIVDPELDIEESSDLGDDPAQSPAASSHLSESEDSVIHHEPSVSRPRMSNILFSRLRDTADESEDELAGDETPDNKQSGSSFRPILNQANIRSRLSTGVAPPSASRNLGFTPLAAKIRGWAASSPAKKVKASEAAALSRGLFSPVAQIHVEGSVELNRQETPGRSASKRKSFASYRQSLGPSVTGSPANADFFADGMAAQDFEDQADSLEEDDVIGEEDLNELVQKDREELNLLPSEDVDSVHSDAQNDEDSVSEDLDHEPGDLTTDLIKFTNASDTAMVDFQALASEAKELADEQHETEFKQHVVDAGERSLLSNEPELDVMDEEPSALSSSSDNYADENVAPLQGKVMTPEPELEEHEDESTEAVAPERELPENDDDSTEVVVDDTVVIHRHNPDEPAATVEQDDEFENEQNEVNASTSIAITPSVVASNTANISDDIEPIDFNVTPIRPDPSLPRYINTVVSKVPLRPEGDIPAASSPLKVMRKRARSLSAAPTMAVKRRSLGFGPDALGARNQLLATPKANDKISSSPQRRIRSAAPSPAHSLFSSVTTPGQMSFAIDDFGDSTLDGIDLPEDELMSDDIVETTTPARNEDGDRQEESFMTIGSALFKTPAMSAKRPNSAISSVQSKQGPTPRYAMSTKSSKSRNSVLPNPTPSKVAVPTTKTPATAKTKTPITLSKGKTPLKTPVPSRTPLKAVSDGVLTGAVVHVDVHTSEGADASGIYVELLTSMGARCVRDWRWNPRASVAQTSNGENSPIAETPGTSIGMTHVIYKDGGKRTLEKVRAAKGQVLCVGVGWVLDCEREGKWLDEASYEVDSTILPRGGSRRRKSMEPRMLINANGFLSAKRDGRRSISAEYAGLTNEMKMDLINTPVRGKEQLTGVEDDNSEADFNESIVANAHIGDESELSSTFNSPIAATIGGGGETTDLRQLLADYDAGEEGETEIEGTPNFRLLTRNMDVSTPEGAFLAVDYDPRTAATPMTPYLLAKEKSLVQMSAPPKQIQQGLFERDEESDNSLMYDGAERDSTLNGADAENGEMKGEMKKFQVKMNGVTRGKGAAGGKGKDMRRRTLAAATANIAFQPVVGSPLRKQD